jgi:hypothetical protein
MKERALTQRQRKAVAIIILRECARLVFKVKQLEQQHSDEVRAAKHKQASFTQRDLRLTNQRLRMVRDALARLREHGCA